jgi:FtsP/CotA-like multicopper oxidase with cupredoxin domain
VSRLGRRGFLLGAGGLALLAGVAGTTTLLPGAGTDTGQTGVLLRSSRPLPAPFTQPLRLPPVLRPTRVGRPDVYEITQTVARQAILPGTTTEIWGYNGVFPGPTLELTTGRPALVRHTNRLPVPTVVHLHGGHTPAAHDGFPTDLVLPLGARANPLAVPGMGAPDPGAVFSRGTRDYLYPLNQRAATLWYHDHRMGFTAPGVWQGLAGFALVRDPEEAALPLPRGDRELPLMITDRAFAADGSMPYPALDPTLTTPGVIDPYTSGLLGDTILVNGTPWPIATVPAVRHRLRLLNASNARRYRLALDPPPPGGGGLVQIGTDGGLLGAPVVRDTIDLSPGERVDLVVDFARYRPREQVRLANQLGTGPCANVMLFDLAGPAPDDSALPTRLAETPTTAPTPSPAVPVRDFQFRNNADAGWTINGLPFDPARPDAIVARDTTEVWRFTGDAHHPLHAHLDPFLVVSRDGEPQPTDVGWKDTLYLAPYQQVAVLVRFTDYPGRFLLHCHNLEHEDMAMMSTFTIT